MIQLICATGARILGDSYFPPLVPSLLTGTHRRFKRGECREDFKMPSLLALAPEIQSQILSYLLVPIHPVGLQSPSTPSTGTDPIHSAQTSDRYHTILLDFNEGDHVVRAADITEVAHPAKAAEVQVETVATTLIQDFRSLCLVCKSIRSIARYLLFSRNEWLLQLYSSRNDVARIREY